MLLRFHDGSPEIDLKKYPWDLFSKTLQKSA